MENKGELNLGGVQVSGMLHYARVVAVVSVFDDRLKEVSKHLMRNKNILRLSFSCLTSKTKNNNKKKHEALRKH